MSIGTDGSNDPENPPINHIIFQDEEYLSYPQGTRIDRILRDVGLAKSLSEIRGSHWKNYKIPQGFTDLHLNGLSIWKGLGNGIHPHRLTIMNHDLL